MEYENRKRKQQQIEEAATAASHSQPWPEKERTSNAILEYGIVIESFVKNSNLLNSEHSLHNAHTPTSTNCENFEFWIHFSSHTCNFYSQPFRNRYESHIT